MTSANFGRAMDLSALKSSAPAGGGGAPAGGARYVVEVADVKEFEGLLRKSLQHPVVVEFTSARAEGAAQLSKDLADLANAAGGKYLLARVDCDQHLEIAQALRIQAVPTAVAFIGGQPLPLFEGAYSKDQISAVLDQVVQTAAANGVIGQAEPVAGGAPQGDDEGESEAAPDPRYAAAYDAMEAGDFAKAVEEFDKLLAETPGDSEAQAGRAQAGLLARSMGLTGDEVAKADAAPDDLDAQLAAADAQLVQGDSAGAFARLIDVVRRTSGDDRDRVRKHLIELFETIGNSDPAVLKARRDLMTALF
ncbi:tetratricopeptide repeat protein [Mariniluteicoccus endophyticus]